MSAFAKLFTTPQGQFLLTIDSTDHKWTLTARYHVDFNDSGADCVITKTGEFEFSDDGEEARDKAFEEFGQDDADVMVAAGVS